PLMPIGPARVAEPHSGFAIDAAVFTLGALATVIVVVLIAAWPAWRDARWSHDAGHELGLRTPARLHAMLVRAGAPPTAGVGIGHAVDPGRGTRAVPARSALVGVAVAVAAVTGAAIFATNLSRFIETPHRYGQTWDLSADAQFSGLATPAIDRFL